MLFSDYHAYVFIAWVSLPQIVNIVTLEPCFFEIFKSPAGQDLILQLTTLPHFLFYHIILDEAKS
jgi:hypothetical protein